MAMDEVPFSHLFVFFVFVDAIYDDDEALKALPSLRSLSLTVDGQHHFQVFER
jgi:hypothetical protein